MMVFQDFQLLSIMDMANVTINIELTSTGLKSYIDTKYFDDSEKVMVDHMRNDDSLSDSFSINQLGYTLDRFLNFGYTK